MPPASKKKRPEAVTLELPQGRFSTLIYTNAVGMELVDDHPLIHFGFLQKGILVSCFAIMLERECVESQATNWAQYLGEVGLKDNGDCDFRCSADKMAGGIPMASIALWSRRGDNAEIRLYSFSMGDVVGSSASGEKVTVQPIALIRLPLRVQIRILTALLGITHGK